MAHPEWAAVGSEVAVVTMSWRGAQVMLRRVERQTPTQLVLDNGSRYRLHERFGKYLLLGGAGAELLPPSNPKVKDALQAQRIAVAVDSVQRCAREIDALRPLDGVTATRAALDRLQALVLT